ncbi:8435_t:CDS:2, partial [Funneliformis caledonium]
KLLEVRKKSKTYAVCNTCNKLYDVKEIIPLLIKVLVVDGYIWRPKMLYPIPCLKTQIFTMYKRPGFEQLLRKWVDRDIGPE